MITVTRKQIIKALRTEPLEAGSFFSIQSSGTVSDCNVCAVGAVLRSTQKVSLKNTYLRLHKWGMKVVKGIAVVEDRYSYGQLNEYQTIRALLKEKNYLGALSCYFENMAERGRIRRERLVSFVKRHFPSALQIPSK